MIPVSKEINRFSIFYCCVTGNDKRKYNWIEAQAWLPHRIFATKLALIWYINQRVPKELSLFGYIGIKF